MQNKKILIIALCGVLAILLLLLGVCVALLIGSSGGSSGDVYQKQLELGNKYLAEEDYEQAIAAYKAAIEEDPTQEEPYYQLAVAYRSYGRLADAKLVLAEGIEKTGSIRLKELYQSYFGASYEDDKVKLEESTAVYISSSFTQIIANYTFDNYRTEFTGYDFDRKGKTFTATFSEIDGVLYFFNDGDHKSIDDSNDMPYPEVRPNYVIVDDLSQLFAGLTEGDGLSLESIKAMGATDVQKKHDTAFGSYVYFVYNHCVAEIALDKDGEIVLGADNKLYSEFGTAAENKEFSVELKVISATTAKGVEYAEVYVYEGKGTDSSPVCTTKTEPDGNFTFEARAGKYTIEVICEGYVPETFEIEVFTTGLCSVEALTISPELSDGEIRIVLEWGDHPRDLDSYYIDSNGDVQVSYWDRAFYDGDELVAELDVDDTNGYGPETLTVYDTSRSFTYSVCDYTNTGDLFGRTDVTVKVYVSGQSQPYVFSPPGDSSITDPVWTVFSYENGQITYIGEPGSATEGSK